MCITHDHMSACSNVCTTLPQLYSLNRSVDYKIGVKTAIHRCILDFGEMICAILAVIKTRQHFSMFWEVSENKVSLPEHVSPLNVQSARNAQSTSRFVSSGSVCRALRGGGGGGGRAHGGQITTATCIAPCTATAPPQIRVPWPRAHGSAALITPRMQQISGQSQNPSKVGGMTRFRKSFF